MITIATVQEMITVPIATMIAVIIAVVAMVAMLLRIVIVDLRAAMTPAMTKDRSGMKTTVGAGTTMTGAGATTASVHTTIETTGGIATAALLSKAAIQAKADAAEATSAHRAAAGMIGMTTAFGTGPVPILMMEAMSRKGRKLSTKK